MKKLLLLHTFILSFVLSYGSMNSNCFAADYAVEKEVKKELLVFPNPATNYVKISFEEDYNENFKIRVFDLLGKEYKIEVEKEEDRLVKLQLNNFSTGYYFVEVIFPNKHRVVKKFMVKHS